MELDELLDPRVLLVTGKGGVGKSSVAAALAVAGARTGRRTCLIEVEGRQTMARLFDTQPWDFTEREFRPGLFGMAIDPEASLAEYLELFYGARRISRLVVGSTAVEFATTAAPGIKDVLTIGKVKEMERRRDEDGRLHYDLLVVDAPPTGRIVNFLRAPDATTELVSVGPIRSQAQSLIDLLRDGARTRLQLVTIFEEMPVSETLESADALLALGVHLGPVLVNRVLTERLDEQARKALDSDLAVPDLTRVLAAAGVPADEAAAGALRALGETHLQRLDLQARMRDAMRGLPVPTLELPYLFADDFGEQQIRALADGIEQAVIG